MISSNVNSKWGFIYLNSRSTLWKDSLTSYSVKCILSVFTCGANWIAMRWCMGVCACALCSRHAVWRQIAHLHSTDRLGALGLAKEPSIGRLLQLAHWFHSISWAVYPNSLWARAGNNHIWGLARRAGQCGAYHKGPHTRSAMQGTWLSVDRSMGRSSLIQCRSLEVANRESGSCCLKDTLPIKLTQLIMIEGCLQLVCCL